MRLQIAKLGMSKNIKTRDGARHFVTKITLSKASDVTPLKKNAVLGDLEKWLKNHWGGGAVAPSRPPVAAPLTPGYLRNSLPRFRDVIPRAGLHVLGMSLVSFA